MTTVKSIVRKIDKATVFAYGIENNRVMLSWGEGVVTSCSWEEFVSEYASTFNCKKVSNCVGDTGRNVAGGLYRKNYTPKEPAQEETEPRFTVNDSCPVCGASRVWVRGRHPHDEKRKVCPTCLAERMDQIREMSDSNYGRSYQAQNPEDGIEAFTKRKEVDYGK